MTQMQDIKKKSDTELTEFVAAAREAVREERFKDKFSRKPSAITNNKKDIARALTELNARRRNAKNN